MLAQGVIFNLLRFIPLAFMATIAGDFGIVASWGIGLLVAMIVAAGIFMPRIQAGYRPFPTVRRTVVNDMVRFSFANYIAAFLWAAPILILPIMVVNLLGGSANADFYISWAVSSMLFMIPTAISLSMFAEGSYDEKTLDSDVQRSVKLILLLLVPAVLLLFLFGGKILFFIWDDYSDNATRLLWIFALSAFPLSINQIYFGMRRVKKEMRSVVLLTAFIAVVTLTLSYILLPGIGIIGAGVAWLACQMVVASFTVWGILRAWRKPGAVGIHDVD